MHAGVLELLTAQLAALMNLSTLRANQPKIVKCGLPAVLKANTSLYQVISCRVRDMHCSLRASLLQPAGPCVEIDSHEPLSLSLSHSLTHCTTPSIMHCGRWECAPLCVLNAAVCGCGAAHVAALQLLHCR
jgi:hypothetical protein